MFLQQLFNQPFTFSPLESCCPTTKQPARSYKGEFIHPLHTPSFGRKQLRLHTHHSHSLSLRDRYACPFMARTGIPSGVSPRAKSANTLFCTSVILNSPASTDSVFLVLRCAHALSTPQVTPTNLLTLTTPFAPLICSFIPLLANTGQGGHQHVDQIH